MKTITLTDTVVVSDPCYTIPTWCQIILKNVQPGSYKPFVHKSDEFGWGMRCHRLGVIHTDYINDKLSWKKLYTGEVGVDSGQAGIFCMTSYRNDEIADSITTPDIDFSLGDYRKDDVGEKWYEKMCKFTLDYKRWGMYNTGVVSSSGIGDGGYECLLVTKKGKVVGICINYGLDNRPNKFINELIQSHEL